MERLARLVIAHRRWVLAAWLLLAVAGGYAAPQATSALSYDFSLPGQPGYESNLDIIEQFGNGGGNPPILLVVGDRDEPVPISAGETVERLAARAAPGSRVASFADQPALLSKDKTVGVVAVYPRPLPGSEVYGAALPALKSVAAQAQESTGVPVAVTGQDELASGGDGGGVDILAETLFGGVGALVVLALVFGSFLAIMPLLIAAASILTTFLIVWGLTAVTDVSFIVQYLLALIGLGVAIDYALLLVTRWREERGHGADNAEAVHRAMVTAGRSVLFSGITVAVSLAALIALPVPFLRSIGFTGLLIPVVSVIAALTLLPALLLTVGPRLAWPHRRSTEPDSRLWHRVGVVVVRHRWWSALAAIVVLLAMAAPLVGLQLGQPTNDSLASTGGPAGTAITHVEESGLGAGLTAPVEIVTTDPQRVVAAVSDVDGVAAVIAPGSWTAGGRSVVDAWTTADASSGSGAEAAAAVRTAAESAGADVGGAPAQNADFIDAVYGNAWWIVLIIVIVTFALLVRALRSIVLPLKALLLNVISLAAAYGITVLVWQDGVGTQLLFDQDSSGAITVWIPIAVFAFLFGLSMDYEVFLLSRIREEYDSTGDTDEATVVGVARTGRLVTCAALVLFLAFISLSRVPATDVKILATALALGIIIDATIVRGVLAPALVAALGPINWWLPRRLRPSTPRRRNPMTGITHTRIHGERVAYRDAGTGDAILLIHGMAGNSTTWRGVMPTLATRYRVIAPDLPGHGESGKPRGDYSLGSFAAWLRDLLDQLEVDRVTVVGQSLGGGVAMQFTYQHPEYCERLSLIGSGGLGPDVSWTLRLLAAPGAELLMPVIASKPIITAGTAVHSWLTSRGLRAPRANEMWQAHASLGDRETRQAFLRTLRSVVDHRGQAVSAMSRLYLNTGLPTLLIWGDDDAIIPVEHGYAAHEAMPDSRLEVLPGVGHFPQAEAPETVARLLADFMTESPGSLRTGDRR